MTLTEMRDLFGYNTWANDAMLGSLTPLTPEQLTRELGTSFPTIIGTVTHIAAAEWVWLSRWTGDAPTSMPDWAAAPAAPAVDDVRRKFAEIDAARAAFLATLSETDVDRPLAYTLFSGAPDTQPLRVLFQHVVNHGTYHRGQVAVMLRQVGAKGASTDIIRWARERK